MNRGWIGNGTVRILKVVMIRTITATSTRRLDVAPGATVDVGIDPNHIVPLED